MAGTRASRITLWRVIIAVIFAAGLYATYARFALGLSQSTHLTDSQPWGLWVGLGTLCGVGLSAGGFGIAAALYLLGFEGYRPVLRTAVLVHILDAILCLVIAAHSGRRKITWMISGLIFGIWALGTLFLLPEKKTAKS